MTTEPAEHARFHAYVHALSQVSDDDERGPLAVVLAGPGRAAADSAVPGHLDRRAAVLGQGKTFGDWSRRIAQVLEGHALPERRLHEWSLLKEIDLGQSWNTAALVAASDWLQRRLAEHTGSQEALTILAENGRTSRCPVRSNPASVASADLSVGKVSPNSAPEVIGLHLANSADRGVRRAGLRCERAHRWTHRSRPDTVAGSPGASEVS